MQRRTKYFPPPKSHMTGINDVSVIIDRCHAHKKQGGPRGQSESEKKFFDSQGLGVKVIRASSILKACIALSSDCVIPNRTSNRTRTAVIQPLLLRRFLPSPFQLTVSARTMGAGGARQRPWPVIHGQNVQAPERHCVPRAAVHLPSRLKSNPCRRSSLQTRDGLLSPGPTSCFGILPITTAMASRRLQLPLTRAVMTP
jgi:hypothetical protein